MAQMTIVVCDMCGKMDRHTRRYQIAKGDQSAVFDLCAEHAAPVEAVLASKRHLFTRQGTAASGAGVEPDASTAPETAPEGSADGDLSALTEPPRDDLARHKATRALRRR